MKFQPWIQRWDTASFNFLPRASSQEIFFWRIVTETGTWPAYLLFILAQWFFRLQWFDPKSMIPAGVAWGLSTILKKCIDRKRPFEEFGEVPLSRAAKNESMPSSHSAASFAWAFYLFINSISGWPFVMTWSFLIMISRWRLRVHYVSDLVGGMIVAMATAGLLAFIF